MQKRNVYISRLQGVHVSAILVLLVQMSACETSPLTVQTQGASDVGNASDRVTMKRITIGPSGQSTVQQRTITSQERDALISQRIAQQSSSQPTLRKPEIKDSTLQEDWWCASTDLWLYEGASLTGSMICIYKDPSVAYGKISASDDPEIGNVQGMWAGADPGHIVEGWWAFRFQPYQQVYPVANEGAVSLVGLDNNAQEAVQFTLYPPSICSGTVFHGYSDTREANSAPLSSAYDEPGSFNPVAPWGGCANQYSQQVLIKPGIEHWVTLSLSASMGNFSVACVVSVSEGKAVLQTFWGNVVCSGNTVLMNSSYAPNSCYCL